MVMADLEKPYMEMESCSIALNNYVFFPGSKILLLPSVPLQAIEKPEEDSTGPKLVEEGNPMSNCS